MADVNSAVYSRWPNTGRYFWTVPVQCPSRLWGGRVGREGSGTRGWVGRAVGVEGRRRVSIETKILRG